MGFSLFGMFSKRNRDNGLIEKDGFDIGKIEAMISDESVRLFSDFEGTTKSLYSKIESAKSDVIRSLEDLRKAGVTSQVDPQLLQIAIGHRNSFINKIHIAVKSFEIPKQVNYETTLDFYNRASEQLDQAGSKSIADYGHAKIVFERQLLDVMEKLKVVEWLLKDMRYPIENRMGKYEKIKSARSELEGFKKLSESLDGNTKKFEALKNEMSEHEKQITEKDGEINALLGGEEWKKYTSTKDKLSSAILQQDSLQSSLTRIISPLEKSLKKFKNLVDNGAVKFEKPNDLEGYIHSFRDKIVEEKGLEGFHEILLKVKALIAENKIDMKSGKGEKTLDIIDDILENKSLEVILDGIKKNSSELEILRNEISASGIGERKSYLEEELKRLRRGLEEKSNEMSELSEKIKNLKLSVESNRESLIAKVKELRTAD